MTDEFIREVDDEYRRQRIAEIWARYGLAIVVLAVLLVGGVGGWRYWQHLESQKAEAASTRFEDAVGLARDGKGEEAEAVLRQMSADGPAGYALLARFRLAAELGQGDAEAGAKAYDALASDGVTDQAMRDLARLRAASLRLGTGDGAAGSRELEGMAVPGNPWRHTARELLGLAALKRGDFDGAGRWFDGIAADRETPTNLRGRLEIYTALAAGGPVVQTTQ